MAAEVWSWKYVYPTTNGKGGAFRKQDSEYDPMRDIVAEALAGRDLKAVSAETGVAVSTMRNWINKKTKRPQHETMAFALRGCGKHFEVVDDED